VTEVQAAAVLRCEGLSKEFRQGPATVSVLRGLDFVVHAGERVAVVGASGSGKTTLLQILGGLDAPTAGRVFIDGEDIEALDESARGRLRNRAVGFVYQFHHLLPEFSALENVAMPLLVRRLPRSEAFAAARALLGRVGLGARLDHRPAELSGGERQRVAIARALANEAPIVLADEPTGALDSRAGAGVLDLLERIRAERGATLVVVTHDAGIAARADRVVRMLDGRALPAGAPIERAAA
jgi:lipoprotein-releasing system ATP-binding protein